MDDKEQIKRLETKLLALQEKNIHLNKKVMGLEEKKKRDKDFFSKSPLGIYRTTMHGKLLEANEAFVKMFGYNSLQEMKSSIEDLGKDIYDNRKDREDIVNKLIRNKELYAYKNHFRKKDGSIFLGKVSGRVVVNESTDEIDCFEGFIEDISKQKAYEELLEKRYEEIRVQNEELSHLNNKLILTNRDYKQSENKFRNIIEQTADGITLTDEEGKVIEWNRANENIFSISKHKALGRYIWDIFFEETPEKYRNHEALTNLKKEFKKALKTGSSYLFYKPSEMPVYLDKKLKYVESVLFPVQTSKGYMLGGVSRDITRQKIIKKQLHKSEKQWRDLYNNLPGGSFIVNRKYRIEDVNNVLCKITGYNREELVGQKCDIICPKGPHKCPIFDLGKERIDNDETSVKDKSKNFIPIIKSATRFTSLENNEEFIVENFQDITEQKNSEVLRRNAELAKRSAEFKQQFLANMSHEIRTPLTGVMGMIDFLEKTNMDNTQKDYVTTLRKSADTLLNIIDDILVLSKLEAGKMELHNIDFSIKELETHFKNLYTPLIESKGLEFKLQHTDDMPTCISADENRIRQVLNNLISNAVKFTTTGYIEVCFSVMERKNNDILIKAQVNDTGIGIDEEAQQKLFSKFTQVDTSYTKNYSGIGLGLAISKEIAQLMDGNIKLTSEPGKGSSFSFVFPAKVTKKKNSNRPKNNPKPNKSLQLNILIAEDKPVNQKVLKLMLENHGCKVMVAENGKEAIELFQEHNDVDIILMDIQMPVMDGITATKELKSQFPSLPPVIGISANAMEGDAEKYISQGLDDYISKPVSQEKLYETLSKWCKKKS